MPRAPSSRSLPGNKIPDNRINPIAKSVTALMPLPNTIHARRRYSSQNLRFPTNVHNWDFINWLAKVDFNIGSMHRLFVRPASMRSTS
jgi:hypothetical protein